MYIYIYICMPGGDGVAFRILTVKGLDLWGLHGVCGVKQVGVNSLGFRDYMLSVQRSQDSGLGFRAFEVYGSGLLAIVFS